MLNSLNQTTEQTRNKSFKNKFMITELYDKYSYFLNGTIDWKGFQDKLKSKCSRRYRYQWDRYDVVNNPKKLLKKSYRCK